MNNLCVKTVQSLERALDIIEILSTHPHGMTLTSLSVAVNLHKSTAHRILSTFTRRGFVFKDMDRNRYRLTMRLFELGSNAISEMNILGIARPYLEELAEITNEVIHLVIPDGHEVVYLFKEDSSNSIVKMSSRIGARDPMYCTGVGKSIMSNLPEEDAHKIWEKSEIIKFTPNTITSFKNMLAEMAKIRKNGFAIDNEEHELGVRCIAVAIKDYAGKPIGAISVAAPISRLDDAKIGLIAPIIKNAANNISNALGKSNFPAQEESTINSHGRGPASRVTGLKNPK